ncbi:MAG: ABC transporter permease [Burkholderiaceae bacterium]|nr:MAG: ABC transporter permease [Burkholderiaceae bacterium]
MYMFSKPSLIDCGEKSKSIIKSADPSSDRNEDMHLKSINRFFWPILCLISLTSAPAFAETEADSANTILIGQSAALSGSSKELGEETVLGIQLYFDQVNAQGGIYGRKLKLITLDDANQPGRAHDNTIELVTKKHVTALLGYVGTDTSVAALPVFSYYETPFIGAVTGTDLLRVPYNRYVFNTRASFADEAARIVQQLTSIGIRNIAVFYQSDAHGLDGLEAVNEEMSKLGLSIVARGSIERTSKDPRSAVYLINRAKPGAVILFCMSSQAIPFIQEMRKQGSTAQFYNTSLVGSTALVRDMGKDSYGLVVSQVAPHPKGTLPIVRDFKRLLEASNNNASSYGSMEGYLAARVLVEGLRRAGKNPTRENLVNALESMGSLDVGGINIKFSPTDHNGGSFVDLTMIGADGRFLY